MDLEIESIKIFFDFKEKETDKMISPLKPPYYLLKKWMGELKFRTKEERL